jgi:folylpolyglutamate synthase/dihydropteroate synthase
MVFGLMEDKDYKQIVKMFNEITQAVFVVEASTDRSRRAAELAKEFRRFEAHVEEFTDVKSGIAEVLRNSLPVRILLWVKHLPFSEKKNT